jgi:transcriptional regulator with XRE-family HTH domain
MAGRKSDLGPIGENVAKAVRRFREARGLSYAELARRLADIGREIPPLGLRRIEGGDRKVDVDDLVALALALDVAPLALLLPTEPSSLVPKGDRYTAARIWDWARGHQALSGDAIAFLRDSNPLDWPGMEAVLLKSLNGLGDDTAAALLRSRSRNVARRRSVEGATRKASRGDDQ